MARGRRERRRSPRTRTIVRTRTRFRNRFRGFRIRRRGSSSGGRGGMITPALVGVGTGALVTTGIQYAKISSLPSWAPLAISGGLGFLLGKKFGGNKGGAIAAVAAAGTSYLETKVTGGSISLGGSGNSSLSGAGIVM
jgi:hypothetical protein